MTSTNWATTGRSKILPRPGICLPTATTVGRKLPNKFKKPNPSRIIPKMPHRISTSTIPKKKHIVPRNRSLLKQYEIYKKENSTAHLEKSAKALLNPIAKHNPVKNMMFPIAISLLIYQTIRHKQKECVRSVKQQEYTQTDEPHSQTN